ncbi:hypothetical protein PM082_024969 [Marasmius tenuissimus]|nr:hypothetical protein PM082_024969 [Marasmius tenuissimus]
MTSHHKYLPTFIDTAGLRARAGPDGIYKHLIGMINGMGKGAMCSVEVGKDFHRRQEGKSQHYGFVNNTNRVFSANIFGEVVGATHGTLLGASGTHYWGKDPDNVSDQVSRSAERLSETAKAESGGSKLGEEQRARLRQR